MSESINGPEPALDSPYAYGGIEQDSIMSDGDVGEFEATQRLYHDFYFLGRINNKVINDSIKPLLRNFVENEDDLNQVFQCLDTLTTTNEGLLDCWRSTELLNNPTKSDLIAEAFSRSNTLSAQLSQHTSAANIMDESRLAFSSASPSLQREQAMSFIDSSSDATSSHANNEWQSECESTQQRGKKRKRVPKSSSTAAVVPSFVPFDMESATVEIHSAAAQFDTLNSGQSNAFTPVAIEASIVDMCQAQVANTFLSGELGTDIIHCILDDYLHLMECKDMCRKEFALTEKKKVNILESVLSVSDCKTIGELLTTLSRKGGVDYNNVLQEVQEQVLQPVQLNASTES